MEQAMQRVREAEEAMEHAEDAMIAERMRATSAEAGLQTARERLEEADRDRYLGMGGAWC